MNARTRMFHPFLTSVLPGSHTQPTYLHPRKHRSQRLPFSAADMHIANFAYLKLSLPTPSSNWRTLWGCLLLLLSLCTRTEIYILSKSLFSSSCTLWICIGQKITLNVILQILPPFFGDKVLTGLKLAKQVKLVGQWVPEIYLSVPALISDLQHHA